MKVKLLKCLLNELLKEQYKTIKKIEQLNNKLKELNSEVHSELSHNGIITDGDLPDNVDAYINTTDKQLELCYNKLHEINLAIYKIKHAVKFYGFCELCHKPIDIRRLQLIPETRYCVRCQGLKELSGFGTRPEIHTYRSKWSHLFNLDEERVDKNEPFYHYDKNWGLVIVSRKRARSYFYR